MSFSAGILRQTLAELGELAARANRYVVAFSGGLDSTVLTHALADICKDADTELFAVYVDHGLQRESAHWSEHCEAFAMSLGIAFAGLRVAVDLQSGLGLEAAAREARYSAFRDLVEPDDWLVSAHHRDDQAETVLLNLMRGSGPAGLAGIQPVRRFSSGWLVRPLLDVAREDLQAYATRHSLEWLVDPSNLDQQFDRNYLRHEVLPRFESRWPDAANRIRRSAKLAGEAAGLLRELAEMDAQAFGDRPDRLPIDALIALQPARQRNVLRHIIFELGLPLPGATHLRQIIDEVVHAREDAQPLVAWPGGRARRHDKKLYLLPADDLQAKPKSGLRFTGDKLALGGGLGKLRLRTGVPTGLSDAVIEAGLELRFRVGGEKIRPTGQEHTRKVKKLLQEENIVPWMRDRIPLLFAGDELVAVADLWVADGAASSPGTAIEWINRPAIH
ncbi:MAG: tRNA lysidine(34) synthetase TilS [Woeseiaceae bacterium]|nr:tRNA lysidine(34) synthetase TilS [Woeseiaceae bacterium]